MQLDRNGLEVLENDECLSLLRSAQVGRVAFTTGALPHVLPVTFQVDDGRVLFRTSPGSKLHAAVNHAVVAFEVDEVDLANRTGWSVMVTGVARDVTGERRNGSVLRLPRWAPSEGERVVAVSIEVISGRRIPPREDR